MRAIMRVLSELLALFVDDGSLALGVIAWTLGVAVCLHVHFLNPAFEAILLAAGIAALMAENVFRTASAHVARADKR